MGNSFYKGLVFQPPDPSTYTRSRPRKVIFIDIPGTNKSIPAYYLASKKKGIRTTILYSHGNASDIGSMNDFLTRLQKNLPVNILHYDYIGYGLARRGGETTEENVYQAVEAGLNYLLNTKGLDMEDIVAFGTSVGSGPTVHLATKYRRLRGLVLECAFSSCLRVAMNNNTLMNILRPVDMFVNINKIGRVRCPVILFHGAKDTVVPFSHSLELWKMVPENRRFKSVRVEDADHNDIMDVMTPKVYFRHLRDFLQFCTKDIQKRKQTRDYENLKNEERGENYVHKKEEEEEKGKMIGRKRKRESNEDDDYEDAPNYQKKRKLD